MEKICKTCGRKYKSIMNYCSKCGVELFVSPNRCSEGKTAICRTANLDDSDIYCPYCGAPTEYHKEELQELGKW